MPDLPSAYRQTFYRAAQEGLTNVQKHAHATEVDVSLTAGGDAYVMRVADNGCGPGGSGDAAGFGLLGLRERAELLGGTAALDAAAGGGSALTVWLPRESRP